jgi:hypothetical protein
MGRKRRRRGVGSRRCNILRGRRVWGCVWGWWGGHRRFLYIQVSIFMKGLACAHNNSQQKKEKETKTQCHSQTKATAAICPSFLPCLFCFSVLLSIIDVRAASGRG